MYLVTFLFLTMAIHTVVNYDFWLAFKSILLRSLLCKCFFILSCWFNAFLSALLISSCLLPYLKLEIKVNLVILRCCQGMPTAVL